MRWRFAEQLRSGMFPALDGWRHPLGQLLFTRGLLTAAAVEEFLFPEKVGLHDPFTMKGMDRAVERIFRALREETPIGVYGDFDADGVTGAALLVELLESPALQGKVAFHLPHRARDGYGLNSEAVRALTAQGIGLLVTVDCGIGADREIALASELGMDVIVADHHRITDGVPPAFAVLNPLQDGCEYPNKDLAGVGVAFKLAEALCSRIWGLEEARHRLMSAVDLVALGTVADLAPLTGENRLLVKMGLRQLNDGDRPGLRALRSVSGLDRRTLDTESIAYALAPRLNAAGRMGDACRALRLLVSRSADEVADLANELEAANRERQEVTAAAIELARREVHAHARPPSALVLAGEFPSSIAGLVASRLADEFQRPAFVIEQGEEVSRGSARGVPGFDVVAALEAASDLLTRFGGHSQAGGFALQSAHLPALIDRLLAAAEAQKLPEVSVREILIETCLKLSQIGPALYRDLELLEPCGNGNRRPNFCSLRLHVRDARVVGNGHLKLWLQDDSGSRPAIGFGMAGEDYSFVRPGAVIDCAYTIGRNERAGTIGYELVLKDIRPWRADE